MSNNNGSGESYQKYDGASGTYQEIPNGTGSAATGGGRKKWCLAAGASGLFALVAIAYGANTALHHQYGTTARAVDKALATDSKLKVKANGKLKLFDDLSKFSCLFVAIGQGWWFFSLAACVRSCDGQSEVADAGYLSFLSLFSLSSRPRPSIFQQNQIAT
jgi:hypothetical protein